MEKKLLAHEWQADMANIRFSGSDFIGITIENSNQYQRFIEYNNTHCDKLKLKLFIEKFRVLNVQKMKKIISDYLKKIPKYTV